MNELIGSTPRYVLLDGTQRIGPLIVPLDSRGGCTIIYGFSDKHLYDQFCKNCDRALTPYPLVKRYLQNEIGDLGAGVKLVVLDAVGPHERCMHAATMLAVLEAHESSATHLKVEYRLIFNQEHNAYRVEESPDRVDDRIPSQEG